ncbi:hypothetical protein N7497_002675 [Penicillium chrysogenum]|nr:hypothetical protein N7497_002675 [Penicillium chrysogenum]
MPASTEVQPKLEEDETALETVEDVPVNKMTSFNGRLQQFLHNGTATREALSTSRTTISQRRINTTNERQADPITPSPRRKRTVPPTAPVTTATHQRTTRSKSTLMATSPSPSKRKRTATPQIPPTPPIAGVNPGIMTGVTGYAYAHPSNLFWKLLYSSGITSVRHIPADTYKLPALYSVGNTNIVERPTRDASMLSRAEMDAGVPVLEAKVAAQRPEVVCLVGKSIWEAVWRVRHGRGIRKEEFRYGWQAETENMGRGDGWPGAPVFVATTTSGLAAGMKPAEKEAVWAELGSWVVKRRQERGLDSVVVKEEV